MDLQCPSFQVLFTFLLRTVILLLKIGKRGYNNNSSALKLPPGPWKLPIIGNIHQLIGALPHRVLRDLAKQHGHLMHLKLGEVSTVVVSSAKFAKEVIKTHDIIFASRPQVIATRIVFCDSEDIAFAPYGEYWRELRKICTQELLSAKRVQSYRRPIREKEGSGLKRVELWGGSSNDADIRGFGLFDKVRLIEQSNAKHLPITSNKGDEHLWLEVIGAWRSGTEDGFWRRRVEMFSLPNEIGSRFCLLGDITTGPDYSLFVVDKVIERYYPTLKMGQTLASLEVKSGYGTYVLDFHISKSTSYSPHEKIRLFIAQTDNIEISFCIISPQQVNFLLNGKGVGYWITIAYKCDWIA